MGLNKTTVMLVIQVVVYISGKGSGCLTGFPSLEDVTTNSCSPSSSSCAFKGEDANSKQLRLFPSMNISCNGILQGLTVAGEVGRFTNRDYPMFQIWRPTAADSNSYTQVSMFDFEINCPATDSSNVWRCSIPSISVRMGDIIGILLPRNDNANQVSFRIYFSTAHSTPNYVLPSSTAAMYTLQSSHNSDTDQPLIHLDIVEAPTTPPDSLTTRMTTDVTTNGMEFSTTVPTIDTRTQTPGPTTGGQTPGLTTGGQTPGPTTGGQTPGPTTDGQTPGPTTGGQTPAPTTGSQTPVPTTDGQTPGPTTGGQTPEPTTGGQTPGPTTGGQIPVPITGGQTPEPITGGQTPEPTTGGQTPAPTTRGQTPEPTTGGQIPGPTTGGRTPGPTTNALRMTPVVTAQAVSDVAGQVVGGIVAVLLLVLIIVIVVIFVVWSKRRSGYRVNKAVRHDSNFENPTYEESSVPVKNHKSGQVLNNPNYDYSAGTYTVITNDTCDYDDIVDTQFNATTDYSEVAAPSDYSSVPPFSFDFDAQLKSLTSPGEWGLVVPSQEQRNKVLSLKPKKSLSDDGKDIYAAIGITQSRESGSASKFFEECETYWAPASAANELYEQLAAKKYREIFRPHVQITSFLGSGAFGTVNKGLWQSPGGVMEVAVKTIQSDSEEEKVKFLQEAAIMGQFRHPNVVKLMGVVTVGTPVMIVLELLSNGDLRTFLQKMRPEPGEMVPSGTSKLLLKFCQQISCGMEYLARKAFVHRDLAARNILVSEDKVCKISDFGMSRDLMDESYYVSQGGKIPVKWTAPEAINYKKYSTASDVWSFGCTMYEIWSLGHKPFEANSNSEVIRMTDKGIRLPPPPGCPRELYKLMIQCWHPESSRRPSFAQLVEMLSQADFELLLWREEDTQIGPQVSVVGALLEASANLYSDLQQVYLHAAGN